MVRTHSRGATPHLTKRLPVSSSGCRRTGGPPAAQMVISSRRKCSPMTDQKARWLARAAELRELAEQTSEPRVKRRLLGVARTYVQVAERAAGLLPPLTSRRKRAPPRP